MSPTANLESMSSSPPLTLVIPHQPPLETLLELFVAAEQPQHQVEVKVRVLNYYFLFLALLVAALAALLWWMHHQRRREQEQTRLRGQHALAQDVERWAGDRHNQPPVVEGLNESGEAPPPYKPKDDTLTTLIPASNNPELALDITIPPRALSRDEAEHARLPEYVEMAHMDDRGRSTGSTRSVA